MLKCKDYKKPVCMQKRFQEEMLYIIVCYQLSLRL